MDSWVLSRSYQVSMAVGKGFSYRIAWISKYEGTGKMFPKSLHCTSLTFPHSWPGRQEGGRKPHNISAVCFFLCTFTDIYPHIHVHLYVYWK